MRPALSVPIASLWLYTDALSVCRGQNFSMLWMVFSCAVLAGAVRQGSILDPLADKLLVTSSVCLVPAWLALIVSGVGLCRLPFGPLQFQPS